MRMQAPAHIAALNIAGIDYTRGEDGLFDVSLDHVEAAVILGAVAFDPEHPHVEEIDPRDAEIASLRARLAAAEGAVAPVAAPEVPATPVDATVDTSPSAGGTAETVDAMAAALALEPKFDDMGRDDMVEWLKGVGVVVPSNISKENARKAIDEAIADHQSGQKD